MRDSTPELPGTEDSQNLPARLPDAVPGAQALDPAAFEPEEAGVDVGRLLAAVMRRRWLVLSLTIVATGAGFTAARFVAPLYTAQSTLWLQSGGGGGGDQRQSGPIQAGQLLQTSSWVDLLRSYVVLDEVVRRERLYVSLKDQRDSAAFAGLKVGDRFAPGDYALSVDRRGGTFALTAGERLVQQGNVGDSVYARGGLLWVPGPDVLTPGRQLRFSLRSPRDAALSLQQNMNASLPQQGSFLRLDLTGGDPAQTATTLNAVAERFVEVAAELKRQKLTELSAILQQQLNSSYLDLGRAERALETFRVNTVTLPTEQASPVTPGLQQTRGPVFEAFFKIRIERDALERDRQQILSALAEADTSGPAMALEALPAVRASSELMAALSQLGQKEAEARALRLQFSGESPPLRDLETQIGALRRQAVPDLARNLAGELASRVRDLDSQIGSAGRELQRIPQRAIEEARLQRDVQIATALYTTLQARYEEARLAEVSSIPDVRILDRAMTPQQPLKNRAIMLLLGGLGGGLAAGIALALLLDRLDHRVRYPDQVTVGMGLPILGAVPRLASGRAGDADARAPVVEALRAIRFSLQAAYGSAGPLVVTITSPGGGDGKSFLASNLAVSFADVGQRTIVIDGDIRRGSLHRVFEVERKPGLLDHLGDKVSREKIIQKTKIPGVDFIGAGTRRNAGPELLASAAMSQLLIALRSTYGAIIIDSAPLGAGVDPLVLGALTGNILLVLRSGVTDRAFAMAKLEAVNRLPIRVLGAVLNDVKPDAGYYAYYSYMSGYETSEETATADAGPKRIAKGG